ncbi:MAG: DUF3772 domain-containing protein [Hyphomicrobiales bacterium]
MKPPNVDQRIEGWAAELDQIMSAIKRGSITKEELVAFRERVTNIRDASIQFSQELEPEVQNLSVRLKKLTEAENGILVSDTTPPPAEDTENAVEPGKSELSPDNEERAENATPLVAPKSDDRKKPQSDAEKALIKDIAELGGQVTTLNAQLGRAQVIVLRSDELIEEITELRRTKFTDRLLERFKSLILPSLWISSAKEIVPFTSGVIAILTSGGNRVLSEAPTAFFSALLGGIALAVLLLKFFRPLRLLSPTSMNDDEDRSHAFYERRGFNALQQVLRNVILFSLVPALVLVVLNQVGVLSPSLSELLWAVLETLIYYAVARGLSQAILAPKFPAYRLVSISDEMAQYIHRITIICLTIALVGFLVVDFARTLVASLDFIGFVYGIMSVSFAGVALGGYFYRPKEVDMPEQHFTDILIIRFLGVFVFAGFLIALLAPFLGYTYLAAFSVGQVIIAGIIAAILYICFALIDSCLGTQTPTPDDGGVPIIHTSNVKEQRYTQMMMLLSGVGKILLTLLGLSFFAASWGFDTTGIWDDLLNLFREIKIGEFSISPAIIVTSVIVLVIGILITRSFQSWLSTRFLPTTRLDIGLRNSIVTGMGYLGFIGSVMIAFSQAGLDLSNLAIVAGALSLGIGFGLQSIVSNFVSGIILLAERPIKAGDWIMVGGEEGTVRKINVRSTEIETFDRATVIVPNADFISGSVKNMMYGNKIGRIIINVGVGYDSDANEVREHLLEVAKAHPLLLTYPEAQVVFMDFGASSLDFQLRGFIADCGNSLSVRSDLRFAIFTKLKEVGIEIPFPQRDLHIKTTQGDVMQYVASDAEPTTQIQRKDQRMSAEIENDAGDD